MAAASMPVTADLSMEESEAVSGAVWNAVSPIIAKRLTRQNECAESAWEETRREIDRLCQTAEDQLAEEQMQIALSLVIGEELAFDGSAVNVLSGNAAGAACFKGTSVFIDDVANKRLAALGECQVSFRRFCS